MTDPTETARALALPPAADRAALRDRIAAAIRGLNEQEGGGVLADLDEDADVLALADETADAETHTCDNCEGVSPDTCFNNSHRPPEQCPRTETARAVLHRHGLPEDVTARALALHAQELAATRTAALEEAEERIEQHARNTLTVARERESYRRAWKEEQQRRARAEAELRRLAAEAGGPDTEARPDVQVWPLARVLAEVRCGSEDWPWEQEWADLDEHHADRLAKLEAGIRERGITRPVLIGSDGRLWDGHHRLRIAVRLGIDHVPVELTAHVCAPGGGECVHGKRLASETPATAPETKAASAPEPTSWAGATEVPTDREIAERAASGLVGYRQGRGTLLHCLAHKPVPASRWADFHEVTADDLDDGGICVHPRCGRDLLAPWPAAAPETEA
ncbi:ParB N-terminal domain-containing protein [Streptomyces sp. NPDC101249]|uniref:ParB N-terminal domain-containing protein n=1 Tax=Streptomyces sp. NPDC101249 TaxID=3366140 RepID=UPI0037F19EC0